MLLWVLAAMGRAVLLSTRRYDAPWDCSPHEETWGLQRTLGSKEVVNSVLGDERTGRGHECCRARCSDSVGREQR